MASTPHSSEQIRSDFLNLAGVVQGGCVLLALILSSVLEVPIWPQLYLDAPSVAWGVVLMIPMLACLLLDRLPIPGVKEISDKVLPIMGEKIASCHWYDLILLAALAGLGEEMLFRGVVQGLVTSWSTPLAGIIVSAILFGLLHAITPLYIVLTFLMGVYFSFLMTIVQPHNLLVPILAHALYDLVAFHVVKRDYLSRLQAGTLPLVPADHWSPETVVEQFETPDSAGSAETEAVVETSVEEAINDEVLNEESLESEQASPSEPAPDPEFRHPE